MSAPISCAIPDNALLVRYQRNHAYVDCYSADVSGAISHARFVSAFYTSGVFKVERFILKWVVAKPSSDNDAESVATGRADTFAAWRVEARSESQLLMCDFTGRTRSWLMTAPIKIDGVPCTRLYFGSAVVPMLDKKSGKVRMGLGFAALLGFHKVYSRALLGAARTRLLASNKR